MASWLDEEGREEEGGGGNGREEAAAAAKRRAEAADASAEEEEEEEAEDVGMAGNTGNCGADNDGGKMAEGGVVGVKAAPERPLKAPRRTRAEAATAAACWGP